MSCQSLHIDRKMIAMANITDRPYQDMADAILSQFPNPPAQQMYVQTGARADTGIDLWVTDLIGDIDGYFVTLQTYRITADDPGGYIYEPDDYPSGLITLKVPYSTWQRLTIGMYVPTTLSL